MQEDYCVAIDELFKSVKITDKKVAVYPLIRRTKKQLSLIKETAVLANEFVGKAYTNAVCFEWLCDNLYIIEREYSKFYSDIRGISKLTGVKEYGYKHLMIYFFADKYISKCKNIISEKGIVKYFSKVSEYCRLSDREIFLLPSILRICLMDSLYIVCTHMRSAILSKTALASNIASEFEAIFSGVMSSVQVLSNIEFDEIYAALSETEQIFNKDKIYCKMTDESKKYYRSQAEYVSKKEGKTTVEVLNSLLGRQCATGEHIGQLLDDKIYKYKKAKRIWYFIWQIVLTCTFFIAFTYLFSNYLISALMLPSFFITSKRIIGAIFSRLDFKKQVAKIKIKDSLPENAVTFAAIATLIKDTGEVEEYEKKLESFYYSNRVKNACFGLICDLFPSKTQTDDIDSQLCNAYVEMVERLNKKYNNNFFVFIRKRQYCEKEKIYEGNERKRGAIDAFVKLVKGEDSEFSYQCVDYNMLKSCKYLITLDSDTVLTIDSVKALVGAAIHPCNKPVINKEKRKIERGYGIIAPQMFTMSLSANKTLFSKIFAGFGGASVYNNCGYELYYSLFYKGTFFGKGLIDVDAYYCVVSNRIKKNAVLSHDMIETNYLQCANATDIIFFDTFPSTFLSYFTRLERWARGDFQNLIYLFSKVSDNDGIKQKTYFNCLEKYKITENVFVGLNYIITSLLLIVCAFFTSKITAASVIIGLVCLWACEKITSLILNYKSIHLPLRYFSPCSFGFFISSLRLLCKISFYFHHAFVYFIAFARSFYRMFFSHSRLLEWRSAAYADKVKNSFYKIALSMILTILAGACFLFSKNYVFVFIAVFYILAPVLAYVLSKKLIITKSLGDKSKIELYGWAKDMWGYYQSFMNSENNYLAPDNYQLTPVSKLAQRTSPTNIGFGILCTICARDFGFISTGQMCDMLIKNLDTIDKLEKYNNHLYNWYKTDTLECLAPRFVSTVDNGNYIASLMSASTAMEQYGESDIRALDIKRRLDKIINETDFSLLYDKRKSLFYIGYDAEKNEYTKNHYDLYVSEARLTSYIAIAMGQIDKKNYEKLSRLTAKSDGHFGLKSYSGTMFEYFLPAIFLPVYNTTMDYETLGYALLMQKNRVKGKNIPFGISESGYYAFDNDLNYKYKAFGVAALGLKKNLHKDLIISPYSSFLSLVFAPKSAYKNLLKLKGLNMYGEYGFYEAIDYTDFKSFEKGNIVKSYMAHHVGMSMCSVCNFLNHNIIVKRFMSWPQSQSAMQLLDEKIPANPKNMISQQMNKDNFAQKNIRAYQTTTYNSISPVCPKAKVLSNGEMYSMVSDSGIGHIGYKGSDITLFRKNEIVDVKGSFFIISDGTNTFSLTYAPVFDNSVEYKVKSENACMKYYAKKGSIETKMKVYVDAYSNAEIREITVHNLSAKTKKMRVVSYMEPCLDSFENNSAHPAFSNLFLGAQIINDKFISYIRKPRQEKMKYPCLLTGFLEDNKYKFITRKNEIIPRNENTSALKHAFDKHFLSVKNAPINPCAAIKFSFSLAGRESLTFRYVTCVMDSKEKTNDTIEMINNLSFSNSLKTAKKYMQSIYEQTGAQALAQRNAENMVSALYFYNSGEKNQKYINLNTKSQRDLWRFGISGDYPICLIVIDDKNDIEKMQEYLQAFCLNRALGVRADLVVLYKEGGEYDRPLYNDLLQQIRGAGAEKYLSIPCGIFLVNYIEESDKNLLYSVCDMVVDFNYEQKNDKLCKIDVKEIIDKCKNSSADNIIYSCAAGGFEKNGFAITKKADMKEVAMYSLVMANRTFGTIVSDSSLGYTYAKNSRENKLTPWINDSATGNNGEKLYLYYKDNIYDILAMSAAYYHRGEALYYTDIDDLHICVNVFVDTSEMVKCVRVNISADTRSKVMLSYYIEPVLSENAFAGKNKLCVVRDDKLVVVKNTYQADYKGVLYFGAKDGYDKISYKKHQVFSDTVKKDEIDSNEKIECINYCKILDIAQNENCRVNFILGYARNIKEYTRVSEDVFNNFDALHQKTLSKFDEFNKRMLIDTNNLPFDCFFNTFLSYQALVCRLYARSAFYQCSGAFGFRDQLQDAICLSIIKPHILRRQIQKCAAHQFTEGDVMHWWHTQIGIKNPDRGIRTKISDDLVWLVYAVCEYVEKTDDYEFLKVKARYLKAAPLSKTEHERYFTPEFSEQVGDIYEHCVRAIKKAYQLGSHGLVLMGTGDWNDGMNMVGADGKGESVWLSQFLAITLRRFSNVCETIGEKDFLSYCTECAANLESAVEASGFDGEWYLRAYYDDGTKMGSSNSDECKIDILPQAFCAISGKYDKVRMHSAMDNAYNYLVDKQNNIIKLFTPPFDNTDKNPGYIKGYPRGTRENGGQYTHAAIWLAYGFFESGDYDKAFEVLEIINPAKKTATKDDMKKYMVEPYVISADVYTNENLVGMGGWSWYTGAAGWYFKVVTEQLIGIKRAGNFVNISPKLPSYMPSLRADAIIENTKINISVIRGEKKGIWEKEEYKLKIALDGFEHNVTVII